jgi:pimeloyl-ACP methyl ester carboxylesterase
MLASSPAKESTNVRLNGAAEARPGRAAALPPAPWWLRTGFAALGAVSTPVAAAWAERLFLTPPHPAVPAREAAALADAHPGRLRVGDHDLATWTWGHGPTVVLVHGWGGRGGQLHAFVPGLLARGLSVVAFDGPGHGRSSGRTCTLVEHGRALRGVVEALPTEVVGVIAHSMGGAATTFALHEGLRLERAVFVGPPTSALSWVHGFSRSLRLRQGVVDGMRARIERRLQVPFDALELERLAPARSTRLLVVHDRDDREVPWHEGAALADAWPAARLRTTTGLGHRRILGDPEVVAEAVAFVSP